jgi:hypothetical protein
MAKEQPRQGGDTRKRGEVGDLSTEKVQPRQGGETRKRGEVGGLGIGKVEYPKLSCRWKNVLGERTPAFAGGDDQPTEGLFIPGPAPELGQPAHPGGRGCLDGADAAQEFLYTVFCRRLRKSEIDGGGPKAVEVGGAGGKKAVGLRRNPEHHRPGQFPYPAGASDVKVLPHPQLLRSGKSKELKAGHHNGGAAGPKLFNHLVNDRPLSINNGNDATAKSGVQVPNSFPLSQDRIALHDHQLEPRSQVDGSLDLPQLIADFSRPNA